VVWGLRVSGQRWLLRGGYSREYPGVVWEGGEDCNEQPPWRMCR
jgi:hypothetical protein